jgi:hypothetical protein
VRAGRRVPAAAGIAALVLAAAVSAAAEPLAGSGPSPGSAALRSLVLPGWGQAANGRWLKTVIAGGVYGGFWAWAVSLNQDVQDAKAERNAAVDDTERAAWALEVENRKDARNAKYWFAGLTMILAVTDAYVDAHLKGFDKRIDANVGWIPDGGGGSGMLGIRVTAALGDGEAAAR